MSDWLDDIPNKKNIMNERPMERCPYCGKEFKQLSRHIGKCPNNPNLYSSEQNKEKSETKRIEKDFEDNSIALEEAKETIKDLIKIVRELQHHELTEENIISYFRTVKYAKKYELYRSFTPHDTRAIDKIVNKLYKEGTLSRNRNYWYRLNPKFKSKEDNYDKGK